jgi:hypothetical protein
LASFLARLPEKTISKSGKIVDVRGDIKAMLSPSPSPSPDMGGRRV